MRTSKTFSISFWLDTKNAKNDECPIYARVNVNKKRLSISLKRKIPIESWNSTTKRYRGNSSQAKDFNRYLELSKSRLFNCYQELLNEGKVITSKAIKDRFLKDDSQSHSLQELIAYHTKKIERTLTPGTIKNFGVTEKYINKFLIQERNKDILLSELNFQFLSDFSTFLSAYYPQGHPKAMSHNTVMKHIQRLRKMVTLAYNLEWIDNDPFRRWKMTFEKVDREFLSNNELLLIKDYKFKSMRLDRVRDLFVFSCYTGLSFIDIKQLTKDNIWLDDTDTWISTFRQKTNTKIKIPVLEQAQSILDKYEVHPVTQVSGSLLPIITNEKANLYLKEIASKVNIEKNLTFHMARHTFATTIALSNGMPIETVSKILGHSKITTTQIYARVMDHKIKEDMEAVQARINSKTKELQATSISRNVIDTSPLNLSELTKDELIVKLKEALEQANN
ncbi:integrase [Dokdonia sp. Dokd-P16]|uniref:site-specific integrase n=1 Tax=Dokdonia sp. Dokd-P16 TaxID=2173169 RepID=UPI000D548E52|nr:site-specific integrase [Dokdonia sp. Dokd-P16]AWH75469.1 integrase [Dokdonia sp. Dokd-P16]